MMPPTSLQHLSEPPQGVHMLLYVVHHVAKESDIHRSPFLSLDDLDIPYPPPTTMPKAFQSPRLSSRSASRLF